MGGWRETAPEHPPRGKAYCRQRRICFEGTDQTVRSRNPETGNPRHRSVAPEPLQSVSSVALSPHRRVCIRTGTAPGGTHAPMKNGRDRTTGAMKMRPVGGCSDRSRLNPSGGPQSHRFQADKQNQSNSDQRTGQSIPEQGHWAHPINPPSGALSASARERAGTTSSAARIPSSRRGTGGWR
jgi:hypothetical protein